MNAFVDWINVEFWKYLNQTAVLRVHNGLETKRSWGVTRRHTVAKLVRVVHDHGYFKQYDCEIRLLEGGFVRGWSKGQLNIFGTGLTR